MQALIDLWIHHGTKILGTLATIVAGLVTIPGLIPDGHKPYWAAVNVILGALTVGRGFENSRFNHPRVE
ncbi:MAG: hypothetical protein RML32_04070 [Gammaproteobacteria bacterium]|nr:hypothetical protein [Gammaproteobacteria bacterium]